MGLVLNKPRGLQLGDVFDQIEVNCLDKEVCGIPIHNGGPLAPERGFVLHQEGIRWPSTFHIGGELYLTTSKEIIVDLAKGRGPSKFLMALGYSGWGPEQLESEIKSNAWLTAPVDETFIFDVPVNDRWDQAAKNIGVDICLMSGNYGHA